MQITKEKEKYHFECDKFTTKNYSMITLFMNIEHLFFKSDVMDNILRKLFLKSHSIIFENIERCYYDKLQVFTF